MNWFEHTDGETAKEEVSEEDVKVLKSLGYAQ